MKIKNVRTNTELTQDLLAEKTNIPIRTIRSYEQGTRDIDTANVSNVINLAYSLDCRLEDILEDAENIYMLKNIYK